MLKLSIRQQAIFHRVVDLYIETAQPVGSKSISTLYRELYHESYSSATVRHEMGRLEEMGYLMHPHTSAGRVPTDKGYRYYVNHNIPEVRADEMMDLSAQSGSEDEDYEQIGEQICSELSERTDQIALYASRSLVKKASYSKVRVHVQGSSRILNKPEFQDICRIQKLLSFFDEKKRFEKWFFDVCSDENRPSVLIGRENEAEELSDCSVIRASFETDRRAKGFIAVIGPKRLPYKEVVPAVIITARKMRRILEH